MIQARFTPALTCALALLAAACGQSDLSRLDMGDPPVKPLPAISQNQKIKVVGSSTVAPFARTAAERFGATTRFSTPIVETTGTGGGFKAFCGGVGPLEPSIANASRAMKTSERELCAKAGVTAITELAIGYDGIVVANSKVGPDFDITKAELYLALARDIPDGAGGFRPNPHKAWNEVNPALPAEPILVFGPPPTSGTRDAFVELGLELGALQLPELAALKASDEDAFKNRAHTVRTDGLWIDFGENDSAIVQSLVKSPEAIGILGFSFLEQNGDRVKGAKLGGVDASFENIADGDYGLARIMYFYVKDQNVPLLEGLGEFIREYVSEGAMGDDGYLIEKGLIPLVEADRRLQQEKARAVTARTSAY